MKTILSKNNMEICDKFAINNKISLIDLIDLVGKNLYHKLNHFKHFLILVGKGNNGKDGLSLALHALNDNKDVDIILCDNIDKNDHFYNKIKDKINIYNIDDNINFDKYDVIIDAIFGINFKNKFNDKLSDFIDVINKISTYKVSIDINSGIDASNGITINAFISDLTIAINYYKPGHFLNDAKDYIKKLDVIDVGIDNITTPMYLFEYDDFINKFPKRKHNSNKKTYGYVAIFGGSIKYPGSVKLACLASIATLRSGAGIVTLVVQDIFAKYYISDVYEQTLYPFKSNKDGFIFDKDSLDYLINTKDVIAIGMGLENNVENTKIVEYIIKNYDKKLIIDAGALNILSSIDLDILNHSNAKIVLTPHIKEFSKLIDVDVNDIAKDPVKYVLSFTNKYKNVVLLLKGSSSIIAKNDEIYFINLGSPSLSKGGSGDILSGIIAGCAGYMDIFDATLCATYMFLYIGDKLDNYSTIGRDIVDKIVNILSTIDKILDK